MIEAEKYFSGNEEDVFIILSLLSWKLVYIIVKQTVHKDLSFLWFIIASYCIF